MANRTQSLVDELMHDSQHRSVDLQICEFGGGGVRLTGWVQLSAKALLATATSAGKILTITTAVGKNVLVIEAVDDTRGVAGVAAVHDPFPAATTVVVGPFTSTSVHPFVKSITTDHLLSVVTSCNAVDVMIRADTITIIALVADNIRGGLTECTRKNHHARSASGSTGTPRSCPMKTACRTPHFKRNTPR